MIEVKVPPKITYDNTCNIFVKEKLLDSELCDNLIEEHKERVMKGSSSFHKGVYSKYDLPINHKIHDKLCNIWEEAIQYFGTDIKFVEPYNIKKYSFGNFYDYHTDHFTSKLDRRLSLIVQLSDSDNYGAGNLVIDKKTMTREKGSIIIFPSNYRHKVEAIGHGERWVLIGWGWS